MITNPIILYEGKYSQDDLQFLKNENKIWQVVDVYKQQLEELFEVLYPNKKFTPDYKEQLYSFIKKRSGNNPELKGNWVYYSWNGYLVHTLGELDCDTLRNNRNKNLITQEEQNKLKGVCVGFVGLSVGSHFAIGMAYGGIANTMKLAEFDTLSTSNLNRIRAGLKDVGTKKIDLAVQEIYDINPYADLALFSQGLNEENLTEFLYKDRKPALIFEAIDDFEMKIKLRLAARKAEIPIIMLTNLGDNILVDIERYDQDPKLELFNGLIGDTPEEILKVSISEKEKIKYAVKIVGLENIPTRALQSLLEINKTLVGRPQLYSTVSIAGGLASYLVRKLLLDNELKSGRYYISLPNLLNLDLDRDESLRKELQIKLNTILDL